MARYSHSNPSKKPVSLILGAGLVTIVIWGVYAWKNAGDPDERRTDSPLSIVQNPSDHPIQGDKSEHLMTPLRATRPSKHAVAMGPSGDSLTSAPPGERSMSTAGNRTRQTAIRANTPARIEEAMNRDDSRSPSDDQESPSGLTVSQINLPKGRRALETGDFISARQIFSHALSLRRFGNEQSWLRGELVNLADAMIFSQALNPRDPLIGSHRVSSGQTLYEIAARYKITPELLMSINQVTNPNRIVAGARLKVIHGPFRATISKSRHRLDVFLGEVLVRSFRVGLGTNGGTPLGQWIIKNKLTNPGWTDPRNGQHYLPDDPDNPIGERWIGLQCVQGECLGREGFGIHGTIDPQSIGANMSMGCVRLVPEDITRVYDLLVRKYSRIEIRS